MEPEMIDASEFAGLTPEQVARKRQAYELAITMSKTLEGVFDDLAKLAKLDVTLALRVIDTMDRTLEPARLAIAEQIS